MQTYRFYLVNVFARQHFGGNPLAVFPEADGLTETQMQQIARQFNLSETVFILSPTRTDAVRKLKIFTPDHELPFAGHPTIGSAFIIRQLFTDADRYTLETEAKLAEITHQNDLITFALNGEVQTEPCHIARDRLAEVLGLQECDIAETQWVNTGTWQLLIQLADRQAVSRCRVSPTAFAEAFDGALSPSCYVWFAEAGTAQVRLFAQHGSSLIEDPGTGSAAANLGGWLLARRQIPAELMIRQGDEIGRPNRLSLKVEADGRIFVGGNVIKVGSGEFTVA
ncbi:PhzF family phenazine biosynthesis protein [Neisseria animalis]|uniref:PhzF family phenazine biosynthesis protein n=1 Tax=Neisseria animalis TaxID=492 RepID=A0A5P3MRF5_NEIAN|nr:PhzF family phenazine biosynthesis protein [Neisseria animalis]QEY24186.1 PhzF family phenazine biosynthesis protein [Neisseria animalis]ROW32205.1 PhzF family phenazine biosynthesis protein [Neisseria animalis]